MKFAVLGNPVAHSKSPLIHQAFAAQFGIALSYEKRLAPLDGFAESVSDFFANEGKGVNVTLPFKEQAFALCAETTQRAKVAGAVNTLWQENGQLCGDNTDGVGLVTDMQSNLDWQLAGRRLLVLGAGGAVRGIIKPLVDAGIASIAIANRTESRAAALAADLAAHGIRLETCGLDAIQGEYDLVINAVSAGLVGDMPTLPRGLLARNACCYDLVYGKTATPFVRWAETQGCTHVADGLGMLVEQAAASFARWLDKTPATAPVIAQLRQD